MDFKNFLKNTNEKILNILYPKNIKCIFCGRDILNFDIQPFCPKCKEEKIFNVGNKCKVCDMQLPEDNIICDFCISNKKNFEKAYCPLIYKDGVKKAILKFKSDNARYLAQPFAKIICDYIKQDNIKIDLIIPVPIYKKTKRLRGYNQAEILAIEIAKILNVPFQNNIVLKDKDTKNQKQLPYHDRLKNVENCFILQNNDLLKTKNILIVDDVMTTGATLNAISKLLKPKCQHIYVCAIARDIVE